MGLSQEELKPFLAKTREDQKVQHLHQLRAQQDAAQRISELVADPRWEFWGRHIEALRDAYQHRAKVASNLLISQFLQGEKYFKVKMAQLEADAAVNALNQALLVAKTLIEQGEQAAQELKIVDNVKGTA